MVQKGSYQLWCHPLRMQLPAQSPGSCLDPLVPSGPLSLRPSTAGCKLPGPPPVLVPWPDSREQKGQAEFSLFSVFRSCESCVCIFSNTQESACEKELEGTLAPLT